jgi:hypothetical protein
MRIIFDYIFDWLPFGFGVPILIGVGLAMLTDEFKLFQAARACFFISAVWIFGKVSMWAYFDSDRFFVRGFVVFLVFGCVGVCLIEALRLTTHREVTHLAKPQIPIERTVKFAVMIPYDTAPNSQPIPLNENSDDPLFQTYMDMMSLASNGTVPDTARETPVGGQITYQMTLVSMNDAPAFFGKLLQYYVFQCIDRLQRNSLTVSIGYPAKANAGIEPPNAEPYPYEKLFQQLADNRFFRPFLHRPSGDEMAWKLKPVVMPKGTEIEFIQIHEPERYAVRLQRLGYFKVDFIVEGYMMATGAGQVPKHFVTSRAKTTMQWPFLVTMQYAIEHPDDSEFNPSLYAQWLDALYDGLKERLTLK